jgi:hypothetical protein
LNRRRTSGKNSEVAKSTYELVCSVDQSTRLNDLILKIGGQNYHEAFDYLIDLIAVNPVNKTETVITNILGNMGYADTFHPVTIFSALQNACLNECDIEIQITKTGQENEEPRVDSVQTNCAGHRTQS